MYMWYDIFFFPIYVCIYIYIYVTMYVCKSKYILLCIYIYVCFYVGFWPQLLQACHSIVTDCLLSTSQISFKEWPGTWATHIVLLANAPTSRVSVCLKYLSSFADAIKEGKLKRWVVAGTPSVLCSSLRSLQPAVWMAHVDIDSPEKTWPYDTLMVMWSRQKVIGITGIWRNLKGFFYENESNQ